MKSSSESIEFVDPKIYINVSVPVLWGSNLAASSEKGALLLCCFIPTLVAALVTMRTLNIGPNEIASQKDINVLGNCGPRALLSRQVI